MRSAVDVAYYMLKLAADKGLEMTNLKLQKLVYIAHGYMWALANKPLIDEAPQAWKYGPVIHSVYGQFRKYVDQRIQIDTSKIPEDLLDDKEKEVIEAVLDTYGQESAIDLVNLTHQPDTPWDEIWNRHGGKDQLFAEIPDPLIKNHFLKAVTDSSSVNGL